MNMQADDGMLWSQGHKLLLLAILWFALTAYKSRDLSLNAMEKINCIRKLIIQSTRHNSTDSKEKKKRISKNIRKKNSPIHRYFHISFK